MHTPFAPNHSILPAALVASMLLLGAAQAQSDPPTAKGLPKVQPRPSAKSTLPAGVDGGTPSTSNSVPLGTPTMPANDAERADMKKASAAARAAARPRGPAGTAAAASAASALAPRAVSPGPSPTPSQPAR